MSNLYDKIYVVNMDGSKERLNKVKASLAKANIIFERFSAIDGNNIYATNMQSNLTFSGEYLNNHRMKVGKTQHQINCNNDQENPIKFELYNEKAKGWVPGEIGLWCSNLAIWQEAQSQGFEHIVIFEDDINVKAPASLNSKINKFIAELPASYDVAFLSVFGTTKQHVNVPHKQCVKKVQSRAWGYEYGTHAVIYSKKAIDELLSRTLIDDAIDAFIFNHNIGQGPYDEMHFLEVYRSCYGHFLAPVAGSTEMYRYKAQEVE